MMLQLLMILPQLGRGEIYLYDSSGQVDSRAYGIAIWNGTIWQAKRLYYVGNSNISRIRGVHVLGTSDIWLAAGSIFHWNGDSSIAPMNFSRLTLPDPNATIEKPWGLSPYDLHGVGNVGTVVHSGSNW